LHSSFVSANEERQVTQSFSEEDENLDFLKKKIESIQKDYQRLVNQNESLEN